MLFHPLKNSCGELARGLMGNRSKAQDKKPPRIIEEIIAKYAVDANLFQLGSTSPTKIQFLVVFGLLYRGLIVGGLLSEWLLFGGLLT